MLRPSLFTTSDKQQSNCCETATRRTCCWANLACKQGTGPATLNDNVFSIPRGLPMAGHVPDSGPILGENLGHLLSRSWLRFCRGAGSCLYFSPHGILTEKTKKSHGILTGRTCRKTAGLRSVTGRKIKGIGHVHLLMPGGPIQCQQCDQESCSRLLMTAYSS